MLKTEEGQRNRMTEVGKSWGNEQGNIVFSVFLLEEPNLCLYRF